MTVSEKPTIGFVGIGAMGWPMAPMPAEGRVFGRPP